MKNEKYFLGLDIGTDSVGYAVTDTSEQYRLVKHCGEPMWGVMLFDEANLADKRRSFRTARRRLDRRQQRIKLLQELFANEIAKTDEKFFKRIAESALLRTEAGEPYCLFNELGLTDKEYHTKYPTIHHLITELISDKRPHDVRLVYIACAWLLAHRGHFLSDVSEENIDSILDFNSVYTDLMSYFELSAGEDYINPWELDNNKIDELGIVLKSNNGITAKYKALCNLLFEGKKPKKTIDNGFPFNIEGIVSLLSGKKYKASDLFGNEEYEELGSFALSSDDETLDIIIRGVGDDSEMIIKLKAIYDWALLADLLGGCKYISESKVSVYNRHKDDLSALKKYIKKYSPEKYNAVFRKLESDNYVSYSGNVKSLNTESLKKFKKCNSQEAFCDYLKKTLNLDESMVETGKISRDMYERIIAKTFLPKQVNGDNRVIPYQVYYIELKRILENASEYLPFLCQKDNDGYVTKDKILSIMKFRVPYYVGPLNSINNEHAWVVRKAEGKIYPWNFEAKVDLEKSEQEFINRMTNTCTFLAGEDVLPKHSLLYEKMEVLNEINNIKVNGKDIPIKVKQDIYTYLFCWKKKITVKQIKNYLIKNNICSSEDAETISGIDVEIKSSLQARIAFDRLIKEGIISELDAEMIINRITYSEDKNRLKKWIDDNYSSLSVEDRKYLSSLKFKDFGRLSKKILDDINGTDTETGETNTVIGFLWETNNNLSEILLSDRFTFKQQIEAYNQDYYAVHPTTLSKYLDDLYVSNAVKRPIIRTLNIVDDVVKAMGKTPEKIFVEMARGAKEDQKKERTISRRQQILNLYKDAKDVNVKELAELLDSKTDNDLQSDKLFLYFMQLGKSMYSGKSIDIERLGDKKLYDIDHIYPQSFIKDDSILNNKVLVLSEENGKKGNSYPISAEIRTEMHSFWEMLHNHKLITDEKYRRLTRNTPFTDEEAWGFINRQLVETRQSTKVIAQILGEKYPETKIVYVKAGLVANFRQDYDLLKSRCVNDLHHAKDAYLNIVCGNAYAEKFTREWFIKTRNTKDYTVNQKVLFNHMICIGGKTVWNPDVSFASVKSTIQKSNAHMSFYSIKKKHGQNGGFFDQNPLKAGLGSFPRKDGLSVESYGGYDGLTTSFSVLARYRINNKTELEFIPVVLLEAEEFLKDADYAVTYIKERIDVKATDIEIMFAGRPIKIGTVFECDGLRLLFAGQGSKNDTRLGMKVFTPLVLGSEWEQYVKHMESFKEKCQRNVNLVYSEAFDKVSAEKNEQLYDVLYRKMSTKPYSLRPENQAEKLLTAKKIFERLDVKSQVVTLLNILTHFNRTALADGVVKTTNCCRLNPKISNWKQFKCIRIVDMSASGIWEKKSINLLEML